MCRRRFFKSYFYIDYNGVKYQNGETVPVSPFPAAGGSVTITLVAARPWQITNSSWLSISSIQDKSGTYTITLTASANESYSSRSGSFTANTLDERNRIVVSFSQEPQASQKYLTVSPNPLNLGAEDSGTLVCYLHYNGTVSIVTPTWSESSPVIQIDANGGVTSNNTDPSPVNNIPVTATYVHEGDTLTATSTVNVGAASIEYRNLYVSPSAMTLGKGDEEGIQAFVEEYVNGHHTRDVEVTLESTWASSDDSIADVSRSGNNEVVTPVYGQGYFPDTRNTTVTATYQGMTASCNVTVEPEGYVYYEIEVSPIRKTLAYGETYNGVTVTYYVVTDGVRDAGTDVTTNANTSYSPDNSATTVSVGANAVTLTGNNTGTTDQDTYITVSYPDCDSKNIRVTNLPAIRDKRLVVTPNPATINADGTSQMGAVYEEWIGSTKVVSINLDPEDVTWSITAGNEYATIDASGEVQGTNETYETQVVTVRGYYGEKGVEDTADITVRAADIPYNPSIEWEDDEIEFPAYWTESVSIIERFDFVDINPSTIGVEVIDGESLEASNLYVGAHYGSSDIVPSSFNYETERQPLGTVRVSGLGLDGIVYYDDLDVYQEAGVETYLLIEHEEEHTDARSDTAGTSLIYTIQFDGIDESSLAISGYEGNISDAYIRVDGESMSVTLDANTALTQVTSDLYIIARTVYGDEISAHLIITQPAYVPTCSLVWEDETLRFPAFGTNATTEEFYYNNIRYATIGVEIIAGSDKFSVSNILVPESNTETGSCEVETLVQNRTLQPVTLGTIRVSGTGLDNVQHIDTLTIVQDAGVTPYLLIEDETEYTEARSVPDGANLEFGLDFGHLNVSTINYTFEGATQKNISSVSVDTTNGKLYVTLAANEDLDPATSDVYITATTVYGDAISAHLIITQPAYVPTCSLEWDDDVITLGAYIGMSKFEGFSYDNIYHAGIGAYIDDGSEYLEISQVQLVGDTDTSTGECMISAKNKNRLLESIKLGEVVVSGTGHDNNVHSDVLEVWQAAGIAPYLYIENVTSYTANTDSAATIINFDISYAGVKNIQSIGYYYEPGMQGSITAVTLNLESKAMSVSLVDNNVFTEKTSILHISAMSVYDDVMIATLTIVQEPAEIPIPTYTITFMCRDCDAGQSVTADTLEYKINDGSWVTVPTPRTGFTVTVNEFDVVHYRGTLNGYYSVEDSETITQVGTIFICFTEIVPDPYFEIVSVESRPSDLGWYENEVMPNGTVLLHPFCNNPVVTYSTNIRGVVPVFTYYSGSTGWISGITENTPMSTGDNRTFTLTATSSLDTAIYNLAKITFKNSNNNAVLEELPIMVVVDEKTENDYVYISKTSSTPSEGKLTYSISAAETDVNVWVRGNTAVKVDYPTGLTFYNGTTGEQIIPPATPGQTYRGPLVLFPTQIMGYNTYTTSNNPWLHLVIRVPRNTSTSDKTYSLRFETEYYSEFDLSWHDHADITINQSRNTTYRDNFYINSFYLITNNYTGDSGTSITIPSSALTYHMASPDFEPAMMTGLDIRCHEYDVAGSIDREDATYSDYLVTSGTGIAVDTAKVSIEYPTWWMSLANGIDGTEYSYTPVAGSPWRLNVKANQGYDTGNTRSGNVKVTWNYYPKQGGTSAKTVNVSQLYGQASRKDPVYIYSVSGTTQPGNPTQTSIAFNSPRSNIYMELSGISGTMLVFDSYMGDASLNQNLAVIIGGKTITTSDATYSITANQLTTLQIIDKGHSSSYNVTLRAAIAGAPTGYSSTPIFINIIRS